MRTIKTLSLTLLAVVGVGSSPPHPARRARRGTPRACTAAPLRSSPVTRTITVAAARARTPRQFESR